MKLSIEKRYHFYAAHRNEEIGGKCGSIHGHEYRLKVRVCHPQNSSVTILFADIDAIVEPVIDRLDHALLLHENDPAASLLFATGACEKIYWTPFVTSVENMAKHLFHLLVDLGLMVSRVELQETNSSICIYENEAIQDQ